MLRWKFEPVNKERTAVLRDHTTWDTIPVEVIEKALDAAHAADKLDQRRRLRG